MKIRCLCILIGCVATLNISAQNLSKPVIKKTEVQTPKRTTITESKKKAVSRIVPQRKSNSSYSSSSNSYQPQLSAEEMNKIGDGNYEKGYYSEAVKWYRKSAEQGNASGQYNLGCMYEFGYGVSQDYSEAVKWYLKSAEQGNATAQIHLGRTYDWGIGVSKDYSEAVKWYRKAAEQGNKLGQAYLALMYEFGSGVSKDYSEAVKWYRKAARQGNEFAKKKLRELNETW